MYATASCVARTSASECRAQIAEAPGGAWKGCCTQSCERQLAKPTRDEKNRAANSTTRFTVSRGSEHPPEGHPRTRGGSNAHSC